MLFSRFVTDGRTQGQFFAVGQLTRMTAHEDTKTGLLEDRYVVVVRVPHRPATTVPAGILIAIAVYETAVTVGPELKLVGFIDLRKEI